MVPILWTIPVLASELAEKLRKAGASLVPPVFRLGSPPSLDPACRLVFVSVYCVWLPGRSIPWERDKQARCISCSRGGEKGGGEPLRTSINKKITLKN